MNDLAVIVCEWGEDRIRSRRGILSSLESQIGGFSLTGRSSGVLGVWVDARVNKVYHPLGDWDRVSVKWDESAAGIWQKEALWNVGAHWAIRVGCKYMVFMDMDVQIRHPNWISSMVSKLSVGSNRLVQGFRFVQDDYDEDWAYQSVASRAAGIDSDLGVNPGLVWGMTREFYLAIGGFNPFYYLGGGDSGFVSEVLDIPGVEVIPSIRRTNLPHGVYDYVDVDVVHVNHGNRTDRLRYSSRVSAYQEGSAEMLPRLHVNGDGLLCAGSH